MEFKVNFYTDGSQYVAEIYERPIGFAHLMTAREIAGCNFSASKMQDFIRQFKTDPNIDIEESIAKRSGLFLETWNIRVYCERGVFNEFVEEFGIIERENEGAVISAKFEYRLNSDKVLQAWEAKGFPTHWKKERLTTIAQSDERNTEDDEDNE